MKKLTSLVLTLILTMSITAGAFAAMPETAGPPDFDVTTVITPGALTVWNPTAHEPKVSWHVTEQDALDLLTLASLAWDDLRASW